MRVAVVGGTGNVGQGVTAALADRQHDVIVLSRSPMAGGAVAGVGHRAVDRHDRSRFETIIAGLDADAVVDLVAFDAADAVSTARAAADIPRAVLCSSVSVYGRQTASVPVPETTPLRPAGRYGIGKVDAEAAFRRERAADGLATTILRPGLVYGRNVLRRQLGADPSFVDRLRRGAPVIVSSGAAEAAFQPIFAGDLGRAVVVCLESGTSDTYNIVGPETITWRQHHTLLARALKHPAATVVEVSPHEFGDDPPGWVRGYESRAVSRLYSMAKFTSDTAFVPSTRWERGAVDAVAWMTGRGLVTPSRPGDWEDAVLARRDRRGTAQDATSIVGEVNRDRQTF